MLRPKGYQTCGSSHHSDSENRSPLCSENSKARGCQPREFTVPTSSLYPFIKKQLTSKKAQDLPSRLGWFLVHSTSPTFQPSPQILGTAQHPINFISTQASWHQFLLFCNQKLDTERKQWKVREMKGFISLTLTHYCSKNCNWVMCFKFSLFLI